MNYYVVVEGMSTEVKVFQQWIPHLNPAVTFVPYVPELVENNFTIISGNGYPQYLDTIRNSVLDVLDRPANQIRLVVCVDSEDMDRQAKFDEIETLIEDARDGAYLDYRIVVQHFCFEAWALGNRKIGPRNPVGEILKQFKKIHDVLDSDPELLPPHPDGKWNRSQFARRYLSQLFTDRNKGISYSKSNPRYVANVEYLEHLRRRLVETGHIGSFDAFVSAFS